MGNDGQGLINIFTPVLFQSTFPRGERRNDYVAVLDSIPFQSTFPRGERRHVEIVIFPLVNFNPRSRVGNDAVFS